jgi:hypothetical protein
MLVVTVLPLASCGMEKQIQLTLLDGASQEAQANTETALILAP